MILIADHPASIYCIGRRGVIVNGKPCLYVLSMDLATGRIEQLIPDPAKPGEYRVKWGPGGEMKLASRWRSVSSAVPDWKPGHGPGSDCPRCSPLFEL